MSLSTVQLEDRSQSRLFGFRVPGFSASHKGVAWLFSGTLASQMMAFIFAPILTRLYSPHEMGLYSIFLSLLGVITVVATLRFDLAIPVAREEQDAAGLRRLATGALVGATLLCVAILLTLKWTVVAPDNQLFKYCLIFLPPGLLAGGLYQITCYRATRQKCFADLSRSRLAGSVVTGLSQILGGFSKLGAAGLLLGVVIGSLAGFGLLGTRLRKAGAAAWLGTFDSLRTVATAYKAYPLYSIWGAVLNSLSIHVPVFIISARFGAEITGQYGLSSRLLFAPLALVASAVSQVFLANAAAAHQQGTLRQQVEKIFTVLNSFAIIVMVPVGVVAPEAFRMIFGAQWTMAGHFALLLTPWLVLVLTGAPLSNVTLVLQRQRAELLFQVLLFSARFGSLWFGAKYFDAQRAIMLFAVASAVAWLMYHLWVFRLVALPWSLIVRGFLRSAMFGLPVIAFSWMLKSTLAAPGGALRWIVIGSIPVVTGIAFLLFLRNSRVLERR